MLPEGNGRLRLLPALKEYDTGILTPGEIETLAVFVAYLEAFPGDVPSNKLIGEVLGVSRSQAGRNRKGLQVKLVLPNGL